MRPSSGPGVTGAGATDFSAVSAWAGLSAEYSGKTSIQLREKRRVLATKRSVMIFKFTERIPYPWRIALLKTHSMKVFWSVLLGKAGLHAVVLCCSGVAHRGLDWCFADVEEEGEGGLVVGLVGFGEAEAVHFGDPFGGGEENLALVAVFGNQGAVEADVVHDDAVGEALDAEGDEVVVAVAFDLEPGGDALAGSDGDFERFVGHGAFDKVGGGGVVRFEGDEEFWFFGEFDFAEVVHGLGDRLAGDHGGGGDFGGGGVGVIRFRGVEGGVDGALGFEVAGLDDDRGRDHETGGQVGDVNLDVGVEAVYAVHADGEFLAAAGVDGGVGAVEGDFEVGFGFADDEAVGKAFTTMATGVRDTYKVGAVGRRGEEEKGVGAELALAVIVIGVIDGEDGQAVGEELGAGRVGFDDVGGLVEGVGDGAGVEVIAAFAADVVELEAGVRALGHAKDFANFALQVHELVQLHFAPVFDAKVVGVGINGPESDLGIADGLEQEALDGLAIGVEDLDFGVNGGAAAGGVGFDDEGLGGFGVEAEEVGVLGIRRQGCRRSRGSDAGGDGGGDGDFHGLVGGVVWFGFDQFGAVVCDDLQGPAGAEFFGVNRYFHFAAGAGFYVRDAFERKIKADQLDVALAVGGDTEGETGDDDREGAERQAIVMVLGTGIHLFADADAVAAGGGDAEIEQGIAAVEAVVRGEQSAVRVKQGERDAGFGADGFGGEIEVEGFTGLGVEFDLVGIAGGVEGAPEADGELEEAGGGGGLVGARFGLGMRRQGCRSEGGFGFVGLGEVVHVELEFAALAIGTFDGDFVGAAGESRGEIGRASCRERV